MNSLTRNFLRSKFREYYLVEPMSMPPGFQSREWGFILFDEVGMRRHKSFSSRSEAVDYIRSMVPSHIYHSAAYYDRPGAPSMKEKFWKGADLIFDLDADHLRKAPKSYSEMLELVKKETQKLLSFLLSDFGFSVDKVSVVFSGGRGYHIHIRDKAVLALGSDERREIVDYLTGRGLDIGRFIRATSSGAGRARQMKAPSEDSPGWGCRINRAVITFVAYLRDLDEDAAIKFLSSTKGIGPKKASSFYNSIMEDGALEKVRKGNLDLFKGSADIWMKLLRERLSGEGVSMGLYIDDERGETDEPVTADVRRLIRFPSSLHGGSGLRVTPLTIEGLDAFNPLIDAVVFGDSPVIVDVTRQFAFDLKGESYSLDLGRAELPECAAVFFLARGAGELVKAR